MLEAVLNREQNCNQTPVGAGLRSQLAKTLPLHCSHARLADVCSGLRLYYLRRDTIPVLVSISSLKRCPTDAREVNERSILPQQARPVSLLLPTHDTQPPTHIDFGTLTSNASMGGRSLFSVRGPRPALNAAIASRLGLELSDIWAGRSTDYDRVRDSDRISPFPSPRCFLHHHSWRRMHRDRPHIRQNDEDCDVLYPFSQVRSTSSNILPFSD